MAILLFLLGLASWLGAVFWPLTSTIVSWNVAAKSKYAWCVHAAYAPVCVFIEWLFVRGIFFAAGDDGSGPPGLGLGLIFPAAALITTIAGYYACLIWQLLRLAIGRVQEMRER